MRLKLMFLLYTLCVSISSCQKDNSEIQVIEPEPLLTLYEDLPVGCDSVYILPVSHEAFATLTHFQGELTASLMFYQEKTVCVLTNGIQTSARLIKEDGSISDELLIQTLVTKAGDTSYLFTVSGEVILELNENGNNLRSLQAYVACVNDVSGSMCNGNSGDTAEILCRACGTCAVAAAAVICVF